MQIKQLFYVEVTSNNYNPDRDTTITITATAKDFNDNPIPNKRLTIKKNGTDLYTGTTNSNGQISTTTTCGTGGTYNFSVKSWNCIITVNPYPIGSIYTSINSTSPATLFGGTWTQLTNTFLYASTTSDASYTTASAGSADAVVVSHTHTQNAHTHTTGDTSAKYFYTGGITIGSTSSKKAHTNSNSGVYLIYSNDTGNIAEKTSIQSVTPTINAPSDAESGTDKNMPPYMKVYMWKRTG